MVKQRTSATRLSLIVLSLCATLALSACMASSNRNVKLIGENTPQPASEEKEQMFSEPYIDVDEWSDTPVRHRYIHGGFKGTTTRFSFYFPTPRHYEGRFFQHVTPVPDSENLAPQLPAGQYNKIGFAIASGAYFVETNGGGRLDHSNPGSGAMDSTVAAYRANAAAAKYSRVVAKAVYQRDHRPYGYLYGGSGGGYRTIGAMENTQNVWDGAVPYVIGSTMAIPNMFSVRMHAMRILRDKFPQIVDAVEPGGSGNPYSGLSEDEASALREVTKMGFPPQSWFGYKEMGVHGFAALYNGIKAADPGYFSDFWTTPGYLGHDAPESFAEDRIQFSTRVVEVITRANSDRHELALNSDKVPERGGVDDAFKSMADNNEIIGFRLANKLPEVYFLGGDLIITEGRAKGEELTLSSITDDIVMLGQANRSIAQQIQPGDNVIVDNSDFLAAQTYHRHQVPDSGFPVWDQFRDVDGNPIYPQRPMLLGPLFTEATSGSRMTGKFDGKLIVVASLWDREAMPWQADWYRQQVSSHLTSQTDQYFRLYYTDRALHGDGPELEDPSRVVSYQGTLQQALRDLARWVEQGVEPPESTRYVVVDGQVIVPAEAKQRRGLQPVVELSVGSKQRVDIEVGESITLDGRVSLPVDAGYIIGAEWDFQGNGVYQSAASISQGKTEIRLTATHTFNQPGTYFPALRAASQREIDSDSPYTVIRNLDRVRVVVHSPK